MMRAQAVKASHFDGITEAHSVIGAHAEEDTHTEGGACTIYSIAMKSITNTAQRPMESRVSRC